LTQTAATPKNAKIAKIIINAMLKYFTHDAMTELSIPVFLLLSEHYTRSEIPFLETSHFKPVAMSFLLQYLQNCLGVDKKVKISSLKNSIVLPIRNDEQRFIYTLSAVKKLFIPN
jgi:hypothetical protein